MNFKLTMKRGIIINGLFRKQLQKLLIYCDTKQKLHAFSSFTV